MYIFFLLKGSYPRPPIREDARAGCENAGWPMPGEAAIRTRTWGTWSTSTSILRKAEGGSTGSHDERVPPPARCKRHKSAIELWFIRGGGLSNVFLVDHNSWKSCRDEKDLQSAIEEVIRQKHCHVFSSRSIHGQIQLLSVWRIANAKTNLCLSKWHYFHLKKKISVPQTVNFTELYCIDLCMTAQS